MAMPSARPMSLLSQSPSQRQLRATTSTNGHDQATALENHDQLLNRPQSLQQSPQTQMLNPSSIPGRRGSMYRVSFNVKESRSPSPGLSSSAMSSSPQSSHIGLASKSDRDKKSLRTSKSFQSAARRGTAIDSVPDGLGEVSNFDGGTNLVNGDPSIGVRNDDTVNANIEPVSRTSEYASAGASAPAKHQSMQYHRQSYHQTGTRNAFASSKIDNEKETSVKVVVRIRPPLRPGDPGYDAIPQRFHRNIIHSSPPAGLTITSPQGRKFFIFDRVLEPEADQVAVWAYVRQSVDSFLQGYNVSILAYGQSGSGKSFTMGTSASVDDFVGAHGMDEERAPTQLLGIIPRAASVIFEKLSPQSPTSGNHQRAGQLHTMRFSMQSPTNFATSASSPTDRDWQMKATYVEIYNEQFRDLLLPENTPASERPQIVIREDGKGRIQITGLHQVEIESAEDLLRALHAGSTIRQTDATAVNAVSSRSHAVFTLILKQRRPSTVSSPLNKRYSMPIEALGGKNSRDDGMSTDTKMHFVDLAGSERLKQTGASGDRAKEGISINAGLASLGKVISQLSAKSGALQHISYRDSKLTRLLQDSLGGTAITYLIACVTPAEIHLSETLNTIQYAQRARAIQSKPELQLISDEDDDKQAVIDRLRAEVSRLRRQVISPTHAILAPTQESREVQNVGIESESNAREIDLQNHLLDVQANYNALVHRHAKLLSEVSTPHEKDAGKAIPGSAESNSETAEDRIRRSNSFNDAVEQVVLEYETTIQRLEESLTTTRSSLTITEGNLSEKEAKYAAVATLNDQLQTRLDRVLNREVIDEKYLQALEAKLDSQVSSGDEKTASLIEELRREIALSRESESQCESYITTLEQKLADSDLAADTKQRELERLEAVLHKKEKVDKVNDVLSTKHGLEMSERHSLNDANMTTLPRDTDVLANHENDPHPETNLTKDIVGNAEQSQAVAEKLDSVTQEFFDLRVQHESTSIELQELSAKYEEALRAMVEMQDTNKTALQSDAAKESETAPAFLGAMQEGSVLVNGHARPYLSSSRSQSSELSLTDNSNTSPGQSLDEPIPRSKTDLPVDVETTSRRSAIQLDLLIRENDQLKQSLTERDGEMANLRSTYAELQELHVETLDIVEELKTEVAKAKLNAPASPSSPVIRRKSSQNMMMIDRAHRSLASLKNIAAEHFDNDPDTMQNFELNLNTAMHELHQRSERVQKLEGELSVLRKEMDSKAAMLSGLARERSSIKATAPMVDMSIMSTLTEQLAQRETQISQMREEQMAQTQAMQTEHEESEQNLRREIESLQGMLGETRTNNISGNELPGSFPQTPAIDESSRKQLGYDSGPFVNGGGHPERQRIEWSRKHDETVARAKESESKLRATIVELEQSLQEALAIRQESESKNSHGDTGKEIDPDVGEDHESYRQIIEALQREVQDHQQTAASQAIKIEQLIQAQDHVREHVERSTHDEGNGKEEIEEYRRQIVELEKLLEERKGEVDAQKHGLQTTQEMGGERIRAIEDELSRQSAAKRELEERMDTIQDDHDAELKEYEDRTVILTSELKQSRDELQAEMTKAQGACASLEERCGEMQSRLVVLQEELESTTKAQEERNREMDALRQEKDRAANLVEELEQQLSASYDQQQASSSRLSQLNSNQSSQQRVVSEATATVTLLEKQLETTQMQVEQLQSQLRESRQGDGNSDSGNSSSVPAQHLRKSPSVTSLPSPPPAIPLPPIPTGALASPTQSSFMSIPSTSTPTLTGSTSYPTMSTASTPTPPPSVQFGLPVQSLSNSTTATSTAAPAGVDPALVTQLNQTLVERESHIKQMEKHLFAEKQLTATLEEALVDLENQGKKSKLEMESFRKKCWALEDELSSMQREGRRVRDSVQGLQHEKERRVEAERAREKLEERMRVLADGKKKKKGGFNCF